MKRPSFQFYPGDWLRDAALRSCSVEARGLWIDMICLMHEGTPYGYLKVNHKVILTSNLARMVGGCAKDVEEWIDELEQAGVFSRDADGSIYSRRMIRDEEIRVKRAAGGRLGGNPALLMKVNLPPNLPSTPSVRKTKTEDEEKKGSREGNLNGNHHKEFDQFIQAYPKRVKIIEAQRVWGELVDLPPIETILAAVERQKRSDDWTREKGRFIPHPDKWLGDRRWLDQDTEAPISDEPAPRLV